MKTLLLFLAVSLSVVASAQRQTTRISSELPGWKSSQAISEKAVIDTIYPASLFDTCALRPTSYGISEQSPGFVIGSNSLGDTKKLQRVSYPSDGPYVVTDAIVYFAAADATIADTYLSVSIFEDLQSDSTFGALLATSDSIRVGDIALPTTTLNPTLFTFSDPPVLTSDSFLIAVNFEDTYTADEEGYVGIVHTYDGCGDGMNAFEFFTFEDQVYWETIFENWDGADGKLNVELFVGAVVDTDPSTSTSTPLADYQSLVSPNPASDLVTLRFEAPQSGIYRGSLTNLGGQQVRHTVVDAEAGAARIDWPISDIPAGLYLLHLDGPKGRQSQKLVIH